MVCGLWRGKGKAEIYILQDSFSFLFCSMQAQQSLNYLLAIAVGSQLGFQLLAMLPQCCRLTVPGRWQCRRLCGSLGCHKSSKKNIKKKTNTIQRCCPRRRCNRPLTGFTCGQLPAFHLSFLPQCSSSHLADTRKLLATNWGCQLTCLAAIKCFLCR